MRALLVALVALALSAHAAFAQSQTQLYCQDSNGKWKAASPGTPCPVTGASGATFPTVPPPYIGNGTIALTTASTLINTMSVYAGGGALPSSITYLVVYNTGTSDLAVCIKGGTCTCPASGAATTAGLTVKAGGGSYPFSIPAGVASSVPTVIACGSSTTAEFQW